MSHIVDLREDCATCGDVATNEVFNSRNASVGKYCWRDAQRKLDQLMAEEKAEVPRA